MTKIAVLCGGNSGERDVSLKSGKAVSTALKTSGHDVTIIDVRDWATAITQLVGHDKVFVALHAEHGLVQGVLDALHLPYTGSGVTAAALAMNKALCKVVWRGIGLPVTEDAVLDTSATDKQLEETIERLGPTVFVKPVSGGSGIGIAKANSASSLRQAIETCCQHEARCLVEPFLGGKEYVVGILGNQALPSVVVLPEGEFLDYHAKYLSDKTQFLCPSHAPPELEKEMGIMALKAFKAIGLEGWGRIDFRLDANGRPFLLEVNTTPGIARHSTFPIAAENAGIAFEELIERIIEDSDCNHHQRGGKAHQQREMVRGQSLQL